MKTSKKLISLFLALCMVLALATCALASSEEPSAEASEEMPFKTIGEVLGFDSENNGYGDMLFVYVFEADGVIYRAVADIPEDVAGALDELDFFADDYDEQVKALVAPLEIARLDNLTEMIPSQEELDALAGKSGQQLKDEGWTIWSWNLDDMVFGMYYGPFSYMVTMEGDFVPNEYYDFDEDADFAPLTVASVAYAGIGDAVGDFIDAALNGDFDGQNPVMNFIGEYACDRAHALVECIGVDSALITIDWGSSAWETAEWVITGVLDLDTLTVEYSDCVKSILTYDDAGDLVSEEMEYENGTGTIVFNDDGTFTWHEDQSEYGQDMVFEWSFEAD